MEKPIIIVICGPTGVGKTAAAIDLALDFHGEIVSADSMQVYRHMDIGTAKPTSAEKAAVPHHLIDVVDPDAPFDAALFAELAGNVIEDLRIRGILPFVVGGTGLYLKALLHGLSRALPPDPDILLRLKREAAEKGSPVLHRRLSVCDPASAARIHPNDTFRIVRALEIYEKTGRTISAIHAAHRFAGSRYRALKIGLRMDRETLYDRIEKRVDRMLASGLLEEVNRLLEKGFHENLKSMQSIGYRHMTEYLMGKTGWDETVMQLKRDSRRYAKRQLTWFAADREIRWFSTDQGEAMRREIRSVLA
ncbi:MAG: tRNA (adenosine(37)-N6)-dimethylallyltransferase MiaA [Thermodesulfobacteriota bacterium]